MRKFTREELAFSLAFSCGYMHYKSVDINEISDLNIGLEMQRSVSTFSMAVSMILTYVPANALDGDDFIEWFSLTLSIP